MRAGLVYLRFRASCLRVLAIRIKLMQRKSRAKVSWISKFSPLIFRWIHDVSWRLFSKAITVITDIEELKYKNYESITPSSSPQNNFFSPLFAFRNFDSCTFIITPERINLQMWDCAQKKALEKIFNLVTNKSCPGWTKGAKISYRKT